VTVHHAVEGMVFFAGVLFLPVLANDVCDFDEPSAVFGQFQNVCRCEILGAILRGIAERLEQPGRDQGGNVMRLAVQHPARLLRREAGGQLTQERQKPVLIVFHTQHQSRRAPESEQFSLVPEFYAVSTVCHFWVASFPSGSTIVPNYSRQRANEINFEEFVMWSDRETHQDCLGYSTYVTVLANVCTHKDLAPLTLGIFGPWGSGKTSLMQMMMMHIEATKGEKKRSTLWFNAWMYEGREEAQSALVHAILANLQKDVTLAGEAKQLVEKLMKGTSVLKLGTFIMKSAITMTPNLEEFAKCFKDESEKVAHTMESFESDFKKLLALVGIDRIVVFIDDLDRCSSSKVIETFETIKLFLNTPACTFVIGADAEKIQHAVGEVYKVGNDLKRQKDYLEKIVQIPFSIPAQDIRDIGCYVGMLIVGRHLNENAWPKLSEARPGFYNHAGNLAEVFSKWVADNRIVLTATQESIDRELLGVLPHVDTLARGLRGNPRQIKRFLNILSLRQQLVEANRLADVKPELLVKFAVLEYVWGEFFNILAETFDPATGTSELLAHITETSEGKTAIEQSPTLTSFLAEPGLSDFILSEPRLDGDTNLGPYLFLAQTSLSHGQPIGMVSVDEKTKQLVRTIEGTDSLMSRSAARRAAAQEPALASAVVRQLLADLPSAVDATAIANILGGLSQIAATHKDLFKTMVKPVGELDGSKHAVALAALTLLQKAKEAGAEVPESVTSKFTKASSIAAALSKPRSGSRKGGNQ
jgi:hypothetical protein